MQEKKNLLVTKISQNGASYTDAFDVVKLILKQTSITLNNQIVIPKCMALFFPEMALPGWLSGERVRLVTWWL